MPCQISFFNEIATYEPFCEMEFDVYRKKSLSLNQKAVQYLMLHKNVNIRFDFLPMRICYISRNFSFLSMVFTANKIALNRK